MRMEKPIKMDPSVKLRWVRALRSGEYKQGQGFLRQTLNNGELLYCCLGVLCELYSREYGNYHFEPPKVPGSGDLFMGVNNVLPEPIRKWAKLPSPLGLPMYTHAPNGVLKFLTNINDEQFDFQTIADWIERQV